MQKEILVTVVGGGVELISVEEYLEVTESLEEGEEELGPHYPSCVGCEKKIYCEVMGVCLA